MQKMPDIVLKRKRLSKTTTVIIFRRNNLSFTDFTSVGTGYKYEESFIHYGIKGKITIRIDSVNPYDMFDINYKEAKIKGGKEHLGIFLLFPDQEGLPLVKTGTYGCMSYDFYCTGKKLYYDSNKKKKAENITIRGGSIVPVIIPNHVSWAATHPFKGGGMNPR